MPPARASKPDTEEAESRNLAPVFSAERLSGNPHFGCYDGKTIANRLAAASSDARVLVAGAGGNAADAGSPKAR